MRIPPMIRSFYFFINYAFSTHFLTWAIYLILYTKSLDTGEVPADWRTANVSPVYKKGLKSAAENYRPISLTSVCCKILEHIIARNIMQHAEKNNILYPLQHGFRKGRSCETQLIEFVDDISKNLQEGR